MNVLLINKSDFNVIQLIGVTNIAYSSGSVTITHGGGSGSYSLSTYNIAILW